MKSLILLTVTIAICVTPAFGAAGEFPFLPTEWKGAPPSPGLVLAQAQAPGHPVTPNQATTPAPQPPVRDRVAPTVPPSPPRTTPQQHPSAVAAPRG